MYAESFHGGGRRNVDSIHGGSDTSTGTGTSRAEMFRCRAEGATTAFSGHNPKMNSPRYNQSQTAGGGVVFVPQESYCIQGSLLDNVCYPDRRVRSRLERLRPGKGQKKGQKKGQLKRSHTDNSRSHRSCCQGGGR